MALSNEWEYMHLTPIGWVQGSTKLDFQGKKDVPVPDDAVFSVYRKVYVGAIGAKPDITEETKNISNDLQLIEKMLKKFGEPKFSV
ncbi:hypothetical protein BCV39_18855 [Vibrio sp. 10N.286.55.E10]|uniref:translation initiation factor 1 n=1 Tax=unclassified Vibrio TaxID=2614977 RepID=UPI000C862BB0|nr:MULTISPECIES: translation initiation factor 1 [unclassified Vibrio]PME35099.1 hypothetical protein BCV39_18855 [Vibrio sp. 10N.286.55.E10]PME37751.1 hypothetical protein BCV40_05640 [Vibrio sp. 10N.286.55.E12]PME67626.1 hypothetical protein BCV32_14560 [Vibrio sp. 10N.286.55.C11]